MSSSTFFLTHSPRLWNDLPDNLRLIDPLELYKSNLKTHIFKAAFVDYLFYDEFYFNCNYSFVLFTYLIIKLLINVIIYLLFYFIYLLLISSAYELGFLEALFTYLFIII